MQRMLTRKERGLGKYDAPLKVQFQRGYDDFKRGRINNPFLYVLTFSACATPLD